MSINEEDVCVGPKFSFGATKEFVFFIARIGLEALTLSKTFLDLATGDLDWILLQVGTARFGL